ncbi:hypothetical protein HELRODRAFT_68685 [Helobdella robusta]|uniref:Glucosamine 6-phosphate N-acetyltransferase n=1 Tax=Helobdella robusta TaxID=6412 RepID=T1FZI3_HELRO|nr:hypothetical protein HELRODRAFT_68685 [Helobdella robusta]ESN94236.1 hypothetical protein HELRODRAFT_68685 [Helobdella robusta]
MLHVIIILIQVENNYLFDPNLLEEICMNETTTYLKGGVSLSNPGEGLKLRPLSADDFAKGCYLDLLKQPNLVGQIFTETILSRFNLMKSTPSTYFIFVIEDLEKQKIVASATVVVERKFIHECSSRGRIEDVVVDEGYRGLQLGKLLVVVGEFLSKKLGCYKTSLECSDGKVEFYEKVGFKIDGKHMVKRFSS